MAFKPPPVDVNMNDLVSQVLRRDAAPTGAASVLSFIHDNFTVRSFAECIQWPRQWTV